jgi:hypothetical protein
MVRFTLTIPAPLGGDFSANNIAAVSLREVIGYSGDVARQIKDLPKGARVRC